MHQRRYMTQYKQPSQKTKEDLLRRLQSIDTDVFQDYAVLRAMDLQNEILRQLIEEVFSSKKETHYAK